MHVNVNVGRCVGLPEERSCSRTRSQLFYEVICRNGLSLFSVSAGVGALTLIEVHICRMNERTDVCLRLAK